MDEIRGAEKATRKAYSDMLTELERLHNEEVRQFWRFGNMLSETMLAL